jgi:uracil-DNA glycosylase family 4
MHNANWADSDDPALSRHMTHSVTTNYTSLDALRVDLRQCRRCADAGHHIESRPVFSGPADARVLLIGQAPGINDVEALKPFDGDAGKRLFKWMGRVGWTEDYFRTHFAFSSVTKCFPGKANSGGGDRVPSAEERELCRPWLNGELAFIKPRLIIPVGIIAIRLFYESDIRLEQIVGEFTVDERGSRIVPLPHPSGASRWHQDPANVGRIEKAIYLLRMFKRELDL